MSIQFKTIPKALQDEGMTINMLHGIQTIRQNLPCIFQAGDEPVNVVKASDKTYWVGAGDLTYLKDQDGKLICFPAKDVVIGRLRYFLRYRNEIISEHVDRKVAAIKKDLKAEIDKIVKEFDGHYLVAYGKYFFKESSTEGPEGILQRFVHDTHKEDGRSERTKKLLEDNPQYQIHAVHLHDLLVKEDYDSLYVILKQDSMPLLFSAKSSSPKDMTVLKEFFHADVLEATLDSTSSSYLYNVVRLSVEREFAFD